MHPAHIEIGQLGGNLLTRGIVAKNSKNRVMPHHA
jgi:hypothetical protein